MNITRAALIRPAVIQRACRTSLIHLRVERGSLSDVTLGYGYVYGSRMSSWVPQKKQAQKTEPAWKSPDFTIPAEEKDSPILKQFESSPKSRGIAYGAYLNGYLPIKGEKESMGKFSFLKFGRFFLRQKITNTFLIPEDIDVVRIEPNAKDVKIEWTDGHESSYSWDWLTAHHFQSADLKYRRPVKAPLVRGLSKPYKKNEPYPEVNYEEVMSKDSAVLDWLWKIYNSGFCFIDGVPATPEATKSLIERIAFIRHTHYGGFWEFTADLTLKDTAYTNEFLGGHTDNTYFTDPARLQLFHLLSHTDGSGGESLLVDAFAAAKKLRAENRGLFNSLAEEKHSWHASGNEDVCIQPAVRAPVLSAHGDTNAVYQIRWNDYDRAPKSDWSIKQSNTWYKAAKRFNEILSEEHRQIVTQLKPGKALIFDNWRMLHGRSEFTGKRRMCGGYVNNDDFISRLRLLKFGREKVLNSLGTFSRRSSEPRNSTAIEPADIY
ncbi:Trimethyllysine dioxygenase [Penicillium angulare]|uniref:trimethyllysine dioxygenase n=1 Tax=Penicillium angulare TaxID=116970 RepID=A0A9W9JVT8_9EURO|nr:Trimethyllysine dioxygenase [Penicillium angulare]